MAKLPIPRADEFTALLAGRVSQKTYSHCVSVAGHIVGFAGKAGVSEEDAATAGLLHDLCKAMKGRELLEAAEGYGIAPGDLHLIKPKLLHGPVAAEECARKLGLGQGDIYNAIYWHTTGKPEWNNLGLALYVADFSEPMRTLPEAAEARLLLREKSFRDAVLYVVEQKINYVRKRFTLDPMTAAFQKWVVNEWQ